MSFPAPPLFASHRAVGLEESLAYDAPPSLITTDIGTALGQSPSGTMNISILKKSFPGTWRTKTIEILYDIPSGIQQSYHEMPGNQFRGTSRTAYLPNNSEGRNLLARLKQAWTRGLLFSVGTSLTTGESNVVTWASIPHKTSLDPGEFGWPDTSYFVDCNRALDALGVPSNPQDCSTSRLQQPPNIDRHEVRDETIFYTSPVSFAASTAVSGALRPPSSTVATGDCTICLDPLSRHRFVHIQACDHAYHLKCINDYLNHELKCPICRSPIGEPQGQSPSGSMGIKLKKNDCPGFPNTKTIEINYNIPSGMQLSYHENPGRPFTGTTRTTYLPNNQEGRQLLTRLKYAFLHGLMFRVGTSVTTGAHNVVTWTSIHHKTSLNGGSHSFPDTDYISHCNASLDALHVPDADSC